MTTTWSFTDLPIVESFADVADLANYAEVPADWHVAVADVEGSTLAIQAGRYKDVNLVGVSTIAAVINAVSPVQILYVFGGDGASLCVPPAALAATRAALAAVRAMAREAFALDLRIGTVPIADLRRAGFSVLIARHRVSPTSIQGMFAGGGLRRAERLIKDPHSGYGIPSDAPVAVLDCSGLECRWNEIPSPHGETVALLVQALSEDHAEAARIYRQTLLAVEQWYGGDEHSHPVTQSGLRLAHGRSALAGETAVRAHALTRPGRWLYAVGLRAQVAIGRVLFATGIRFAGVHWGRYKKEVVGNTDRRKFDDTLRVVLAGTPAQRRALEEWLAARRRDGQLVYGLHVAGSALMTCLIGDRGAGEHLHFVDAAGGGYAMAAVELKRQLNASGRRTPSQAELPAQP